MFERCLDEFLNKVVKLAHGVTDMREEYFFQYREYEIYLTPRQEDTYDCSVYNLGKEVKRVKDIRLSKDKIVELAKEWIDEL